MLGAQQIITTVKILKKIRIKNRYLFHKDIYFTNFHKKLKTILYKHYNSKETGFKSKIMDSIPSLL